MPNNPLENNAFVDKTRSDSYPTTALTSFSSITTYPTFDALTFWNKLEFLSNTMDGSLLQAIQEQTQSKQIKALAMYRKYQLE